MKRTRQSALMEKVAKEAKKEDNVDTLNPSDNASDCSHHSEEEALDEDYEYDYYSEGEEYTEKRCHKFDDIPTYVPCDASKYIDAGDADLMTWAHNHLSRLPIVSLIRQILKYPAANASMMISRDDLFADTSIKEFHFFVRLHFPLVISYSLSFQSDKEFGSYAPRLRCLTYCKSGTYLYPAALLPNTFSKFVDFGQVFTALKDRLSHLLPPSTSSTTLRSVAINSYEYAVQDLAFVTQFHTSYLISLENSGIITGIDRASTAKSSGVGYSTGSGSSSTTITQDLAYLHTLTNILQTIYSNLSITDSTISTLCSNSTYEAIADSPLIELLSQLVCELSVEEAARQSEYSSSLFQLIGAIQDIIRAAEASLPLPEPMLQKLAMFKSVLGDEYNLSTITAAAVGTTSTPSATTPVIYTDAFSHHVFASAAVVTKPALLRRMKIEISTLTDNLPSDITVMISEQHITNSRFLIRGPADTPYFGGFFLFDMALPPSYPEQPPQVNIITTGSGSARFNPNLYACGKVCLSLLGTWSGEKWNPQLSNLNQVLQSILYMIFISEPYFNEPGYEGSKNTPSGQAASKQYNQQIRRYTLRYAILDHLTRPNAEFGDIITAEIKTKWPNTRAYVLEHWAPEDNTLIEIISRIDEKLI